MTKTTNINDILALNSKTLKQQTEITHLDDNGNVKTKTETNVFSVAQEPPFVKMYLQDILYLKDMPRGLNPVLTILLKNIQWGSNKLILNSSLKKQMANEINLSVATIEKAITKFIKAEILFREDKGIYLFNPYLFGCGYWTDIKEIRTEVKYSLDGRTFSTQIIKKDGDSEKIEENKQII